MDKSTIMNGPVDSGDEARTSRIGHKPTDDEPADPRHAETLRLTIEGLKAVLPEARKTLYNRYVHWTAKGGWIDLFHALASVGSPPAQMLIDPSAVKAHRSAAGAQP